MGHVWMEPGELRARGFEILVETLGWVNAVRFVQQYEPSRHNYTEERGRILPELSGDELVKRLREVAGGKE